MSEKEVARSEEGRPPPPSRSSLLATSWLLDPNPDPMRRVPAPYRLEGVVQRETVQRRGGAERVRLAVRRRAALDSARPGPELEQPALERHVAELGAAGRSDPAVPLPGDGGAGGDVEVRRDRVPVEHGARGDPGGEVGAVSRDGEVAAEVLGREAEGEPSHVPRGAQVERGAIAPARRDSFGEVLGAGSPAEALPPEGEGGGGGETRRVERSPVSERARRGGEDARGSAVVEILRAEPRGERPAKRRRGGVGTEGACRAEALEAQHHPRRGGDLRRVVEDRLGPPARDVGVAEAEPAGAAGEDRKSTRLNSSHGYNSYAVFCLKKKKVAKGTLRSQVQDFHVEENLWFTPAGTGQHVLLKVRKRDAFFFKDAATPEIYSLSLHDALPF